MSSEDMELERLRDVYDDYSSSPDVAARWSMDNPGNRAIITERDNRILALLRRGGLVPLTSARILDVGCGEGRTLGTLRSWGAEARNLAGIDLLPTSIDGARLMQPDVEFLCGNAADLPFADGSFDLVVVSTVFSSILEPGLAKAISDSITRVLRPGGSVLLYDFRYRNPSNKHVHGVGRAEIAALFPGFVANLELVTLLPPLARRLGPLTPALYPVLAAIPRLRTHHVGLLEKPRS